MLDVVLARSTLQNPACDAVWTAAFNQSQFRLARACAPTVNKQWGHWSCKNQAIITFAPWQQWVWFWFNSGVDTPVLGLILGSILHRTTSVGAKPILAKSILSKPVQSGIQEWTVDTAEERRPTLTPSQQGPCPNNARFFFLTLWPFVKSVACKSEGVSYQRHRALGHQYLFGSQWVNSRYASFGKDTILDSSDSFLCTCAIMASSSSSYFLLLGALGSFRSPSGDKTSFTLWSTQGKVWHFFVFCLWIFSFPLFTSSW